MDELAYLMDWDLQAIVKGCTSEAPATIMDSPAHLDFSYFCSEQDNILLTFPEISETSSVLDELEELYKPFYPVLHPLSTQTINVTSSEPIPKEVKASDQVQELKGPQVSDCKKR
ncbi:hypothetical protein L6164_019413 [Bauhinia variegata]|nr:hypothetical protein L6164_019413 [Bauhinia variegata]